jgi:phosphotransferase system  glucose/maltose/N-acetylglucosamine-specific IIC component
MTPAANMPAHPAPDAQRVSHGERVFCLVGGPLAWLLQLGCGYALASEPCFRGGERVVAVPMALHWTWPAMVVFTIAAFAVSLGAYFVSRRTFMRTRHETQSDTRHLLEVGAGRTRFLALWGMVLGAGFAVAAAFTAVAFIMVPRCAG